MRSKGKSVLRLRLPSLIRPFLLQGLSALASPSDCSEKDTVSAFSRGM